MNPQTAPAPSAIPRAEAELTRCLQILVTLFPDPEFQQASPEVRLEEYAPLPNQPFSAAGDRVTLYTRTDLNRPVEEILTVLLHQAVHLANAFNWTRDCNRLSRHNVRFRDLAEQVGLEVSWVNARYGWAQTTATARLRQIFRARPSPRRCWRRSGTRWPNREQPSGIAASSAFRSRKS